MINSIIALPTFNKKHFEIENDDFLSGFVWGQQCVHPTRKDEIESQIRFIFLMYSAGIFPVLPASSETIIHPSKEGVILILTIVDQMYSKCFQLYLGETQ